MNHNERMYAIISIVMIALAVSISGCIQPATIAFNEQEASLSYSGDFPTGDVAISYSINRNCDAYLGGNMIITKYNYNTYKENYKKATVYANDRLRDTQTLLHQSGSLAVMIPAPDGCNGVPFETVLRSHGTIRLVHKGTVDISDEPPVVELPVVEPVTEPPVVQPGQRTLLDDLVDWLNGIFAWLGGLI